MDLYEDERDKNPHLGRQQFAQLCDLSLSIVDNYLAGRGWPTLENFIKICRNLHVNAGWLIGESDIKYNFAHRFLTLSRELSKEQMEAVEMYVDYLKFVASTRNKKTISHKNPDLPNAP